MASVSIPSFSSSSPVFYTVVVSLDGHTQELRKRYSEFLSLAAAIEIELDEPVPVAPPAKGWFFNKQSPEQRRCQLEDMLRALVRTPDFFNTLAVADFLDLAKLKLAAQPADAPRAADWLQSSTQISTELSAAKAAAGIARRQHCSQARKLINELQKQLQDHPSANSREQLRRQNQLDEYHRVVRALESAGPPQSLFAEKMPGAWPDTKGRVIGETDDTRGRNNSELLTQQQTSIEDQDEHLETLRAAISRQRELGLAITDEITKQNVMLDELDGDVHNVNSKLNQARKRTNNFL